MSDTTLAITVDGDTYTVRFSDLTAIDAKDFRASVGISLTQAMTEGSTDLDIIAGLVWLARRKRERGLAYTTVAKAMTYDTVLDVADAGTTVEDPDDSGEA